MLSSPLRIGELFDLSFKRAPKIFMLALPWFLAATAFGVVEFVEIEIPSYIKILAQVLSFILGVLVQLIGYHLAYLVWTDEQGPKLPPRLGLLFWRFVGLSIMIFIGTMLWGLLLVIPGIIYAINRTLAPALLVIEKQPPAECLRRSRDIMKQGSFFRGEGPVFRFSIFALLVIPLYVFMFLLYALAGAQQSAEIFGAATLGGPVSLALAVAAGLITQLLVAVWSSFFVGLYLDSKVRYEATDILDSLSD